MTPPRPPLWRHPALAPVYAAALAIGCVALASLVVAPHASAGDDPPGSPTAPPTATAPVTAPTTKPAAKPVTTAPGKVPVTAMVTVTEAGADLRLSHLAVQIREGGVVLADERADDQGRWSSEITVGRREVCVMSADAPVRLAGLETPSACRQEQVTNTRPIELKVEPARVIAQVAGGGTKVPTGSSVTIRYARGDAQDGGSPDGKLGDSGWFIPNRLPPDAQVCLKLVGGWRFVGAAEPGGEQCRAVTNPVADVTFPVEAS
ncbi:hypothetical protein Ga0074812_10257 [Parafrankia irregularis]|uniref:Neocarzinostatin family protein n=1 Tax=Parafrankia irregularis TaxID=795642 RepID=A0A0S4QHD1_9ACTN|nr:MULTISPECIES: hypothetical protein [Parafrankia]MBE3203299.1 hypothetical protein [Parafrankia sp. CH37]CUU54054.1 hypothetical protein Ga0074812_10257 [Parafrankia irregularis]